MLGMFSPYLPSVLHWLIFSASTPPGYKHLNVYSCGQLKGIEMRMTLPAFKELIHTNQSSSKRKVSTSTQHSSGLKQTEKKSMKMTSLEHQDRGLTGKRGGTDWEGTEAQRTSPVRLAQGHSGVVWTFCFIAITYNSDYNPLKSMLPSHPLMPFFGLMDIL